MGHIIFKCPRTGMNVQHWLADSPDAEDAYISVVCQACTRLHFIHNSTGKLLGEAKKQGRLLICHRRVNEKGRQRMSAAQPGKNFSEIKCPPAPGYSKLNQKWRICGVGTWVPRHGTWRPLPPRNSRAQPNRPGREGHSTANSRARWERTRLSGQIRAETTQCLIRPCFKCADQDSTRSTVLTRAAVRTATSAHPRQACLWISHARSFIEPTNGFCSSRWGALNDWLVDDYLILGIVPFQNWMWMAIVIVILGILAAWWTQR